MDGPLSTTSSVGGFAASAPPGVASWSESFGFTLCSKSAHSRITIDRIEPHFTAPPQSVELWIRRVPTGSNEERFISAYGSPPTWRETYADAQYGGEWERQVTGARVDQSCRDANAWDRGFTQLVFVLEAGPRGGEIRTATIDYTANGEPYRETIRWAMILCGTSASVQEACEEPPPE